ncbi:hypothetical protein ABK040_005280 [Willaertia magna]
MPNNDTGKKLLSMKDESFRKDIIKEYESVKDCRLFDFIDLYAKQKPKEIAIKEFNTGDEVSWLDLQRASIAFASKFVQCGLKKGDIICTSLPFLKEHVYIMMACARIGCVLAPLDLRLKEHEISSCFDTLKPKMYLFLGKTPVQDFRPLVKNLMNKYKATTEDETDKNRSIQYWVQFQKEKDEILEGATSILDFTSDVKTLYVMNTLKWVFGYGVYWFENQVTPSDPIFIIMTTGSTGKPKAALLSHESIIMQNIGLASFYKSLNTSDPFVMLVNLLPSHVGGLTEQLLTPIYCGGVAVLLHVFDPEKTLQAIQKYKVNCIGQIPALFQLEWRLPNYNTYDLSSLKVVIYGGQSVTTTFLEKMKTMAPYIATGLGLTETSGFCTYTELGAGVNEIAQSVGFDSPLAPIVIREPLQIITNDKGEEIYIAGAEKPKGEIGEITFSGKQMFLGYYGSESNPEVAATLKQTLVPKSIDKIDSKDPKDYVLYTGDVGSYDELGLHFASRRKFIIKPKGYQVFPSEIEEFLEGAFKEQIARVGCVGVEHEIFSEGIVVFIELKPEMTLTEKDIHNACNEMAAYKRPSLIIFSKEPLPLNRVGKIDYVVLKQQAQEEVQKVREKGGWDRK